LERADCSGTLSTTKNSSTNIFYKQIFGLWVMNIATNMMQGPARALVSDVVEPEKQQAGNAMVSGTQGE